MVAERIKTNLSDRADAVKTMVSDEIATIKTSVELLKGLKPVQAGVNLTKGTVVNILDMVRKQAEITRRWA